MSAKRNFSDAERYGVWIAHDKKCRYCRRPVPWTEFEVDHVIPESLLKDLDTLVSVLAKLGLPADFNLNDYENWVAICHSCNKTKLAEVFDPAPIYLSYIAASRDNAAAARKRAEWFERHGGIVKIGVLVKTAHSKGMITEEDWTQLKSELDELFALSTGTPAAPEIIPITPDLAVVRTEQGFELKFEMGVYGVGWVPPDEHTHISFECPFCGSRGPWNGARCMTCGQMSEPDI